MTFDFCSFKVRAVLADSEVAEEVPLEKVYVLTGLFFFFEMGKVVPLLQTKKVR